MKFKKCITVMALAVGFAWQGMAEDGMGATGIIIPAEGGKVAILSEADKSFLYDEWHFAPVRVTGETVLVSGVIGGLRDGEADPQHVRAGFDRAWKRIIDQLALVGATGSDIVRINSYHVFSSPYFKGSKVDHINLFRDVKDRYVPAPYPAWTAVGVAELIADRGLVEIEVEARLPKEAAER